MLLPPVNLPAHRVSASIDNRDFKHHHNVSSEAKTTTLTADRVMHCTLHTGGDNWVPKAQR